MLFIYRPRKAGAQIIFENILVPLSLTYLGIPINLGPRIKWGAFSIPQFKGVVSIEFPPTLREVTEAMQYSMHVTPHAILAYSTIGDYYRR